ncbi:MAG: penicillin-binding protein 1C [Saprospiraceae bacterium]
MNFKIKHKSFKKNLLYLLLAVIVGSIVSILTLPSSESTYSMAIFSSNGQLLGARLAKDEQWRFQPNDSIPNKFKCAILLFEDKHFYYHIGINPVSICRALFQNIRAGKVISGGSTLSMQDIRLRRGITRKRNLVNKILEMFWAIGLEISNSKNKILLDYSTRASFGTNVVGLEAACWRYFDKPSANLTWAEAACLAVLPNSPSLIHPGKNRSSLKLKRDRLLKQLTIAGTIDLETYHRALLEPLPDHPLPLPNIAPHVLDFLYSKSDISGTIKTTIDYALQNQINELARNAYIHLSANQIHNLAILIADTKTGNTIAYVGNPPNTIQSLHVDHVQAPRSTGSIMKPFLYTGALSKGIILPKTLLKDIPTVIEGFQPKNFNLNYSGAVPADQALIQSLNIPMVLLLKQYGLEQFHHDLNQLGLTSFHKPPSYYGLSLILGGGEASLWDLTGAYAYLGRALINYPIQNNRYSPSDLHPLNLKISNTSKKEKDSDLSRVPLVYDVASIYTTFEVLKKLQRPDDAGAWQTFSSNQTLSWKTGTSFGFRDAWAIGLNAAYTIGIWVGNSSGEGRPSILGAKVAAPILFDVVSMLPSDVKSNFDPPLDELNYEVTCKISGMKASALCPTVDTIRISRFYNQTLPCSYHQNIWINPLTGMRGNQQCNDAGKLISKVIFNLSPIEEYYYESTHPDYEKMPPIDPRCNDIPGSNPMSMIQPEPNSSIYIPMDQNGQPGKIIFKIAHRSKETPVYWHLDEAYLGSTRTFHELSVSTEPGDHVLTIIDSSGHELKCAFKVLNRTKDRN